MTKMQHFAVIGNPIRHSKSPLIHQLFAAQTGIKLSYTTLEVPPIALAEAVKNFTGHGLNVTQPFKQLAYHLVDQLSPRARQAQAINTIKYYPDGSRYGDNTDGAGLVTDLTINKHLTLTNKQILILGAGGAAAGIIGPLLNERPARIIVANRTYNKAVDLVQRFNDPALIASPLTDLANYPADLVVNTANLINPPVIKLNPNSCCYELSYGQPSPILQWAKHQGVPYWDGLGMLVEQAAAAFFIWHDIYPETQSILTNPLLTP